MCKNRTLDNMPMDPYLFDSVVSIGGVYNEILYKYCTFCRELMGHFLKKTASNEEVYCFSTQ